MKSKDFSIYLKSNGKIFHIAGKKKTFSSIQRFQKYIAMSKTILPAYKKSCKERHMHKIISQ